MSKKLLTILCAFLPLLAYGDDTIPAPQDNAQTQVGRYQIASAADGLYLLDTTTGRLWSAEGRKSWTAIDTWVLRIEGVK